MTDVDKPAFLQAFTRLTVGLREKEPDVIAMRVYFEALADLDIEFVVEGAVRLMTEAAWFPKVSEWHAAARTVEGERVDAQRAFLRRLLVPLCEPCGDTGWASDGDGRVRPCDCRKDCRLEVLGRRPWPALRPAAEERSGK